MASTPSEIKSINDYQKGIGFNKQRLVWDGGTATGVVTPSAESKIVEIYEVIVTNIANPNPFKVVVSYDPTVDKDIVTITGTANDSFDVVMKGRAA